jgi:hypothetical protein
LIKQVGYVEGVGHGLVSEAAAEEFQIEWANAILSLPVGTLATQPELLRILLAAGRFLPQGASPIVANGPPELTAAVLRSARSEVLSQRMGSRAVRRLRRLDWKSLVAIYGDEETLRRRVEDLRATATEELGELVELVEQYLSGGSPEEDEDE